MLLICDTPANFRYKMAYNFKTKGDTDLGVVLMVREFSFTSKQVLLEKRTPPWPA